MKQKSLILPLVGGGIALICFFFPWMKFDMSSLGLDQAIPQFKVITISGFKIATDSGNLTTLALLAVVAIIGVCIFMLYEKTPWKAKIPVLICGGIGVILVLFTLLRFIQGVSEVKRLAEEALKSTTEVEPDKIISLQFGGFGAIIGYVLALIGAWYIPKSDDSPKLNDSIDDNEQEAAS